MYKLETTTTFDAAHYLPEYNGKCKNLHGHTWKVKVIVYKNDLNNNFVVDFSVIKKVIHTFDHKCLNEFLTNPTAENIAKYLYNAIKAVIAEEAKTVNDLIGLVIKVWETEDNSVAYTENDLFLVMGNKDDL